MLLLSHIPVKGSSFFSLNKTSRRLTTLMVLQMVITVIMMVVYSYYPSFLFWENTPRDDDIANLGALFFYVSTAVGVTIWVVFYYWFYKAYKNLKLFYARPLRHTPKTALAYFFVPIVNIWESYFNVREIWKYSDPNVLPSGEPIKYKREKNIVIAWWISLLLSLAFLFLNNNLVASFISDCFYLVVLIMWILIIKQITLRQGEKNRMLYGNPSEFKD